MAAVGILLMTVISAFAVINLPTRYLAEYNRAYIRIPRTWLIILAIITAVTSLPFVVLVMLDYKNTALILGLLIGLTLLFTIYYFLRVNWLKKMGVNWKERTREITGHEE
jgi:ABC-type methionine transport system permease subunit